MAEDAEPVLARHLAQGQGAGDEGRRLRAGVAARRDAQRHEQAQDDHLRDRLLERRQGGEREQLRAEQARQPERAVAPELEEARIQVTLLHRADGPHAVGVLGRLLDDVLQHVVGGDDADEPAVRVHDGHGDEVVLAEQLGDGLAVLGVLDRHHLGFHERRDRRGPGVHDEVAQRDDALEPALVVHDVGVVDRLAVGCLEAQALEGVLRGDLVRQPGVIRRHQRPGRVLRVLDELDDVAAVGLVHEPQEVVAHGYGEFAQEVGAVVVRHLLDEVRHLLAAGPLDHLELHVDGEVREDGRLLLDGCGVQETPRLLYRKGVGERFGDRRRVERVGERFHRRLVVLEKHVASFGREQRVRHDFSRAVRWGSVEQASRLFLPSGWGDSNQSQAGRLSYESTRLSISRVSPNLTATIRTAPGGTFSTAANVSPETTAA